MWLNYCVKRIRYLVSFSLNRKGQQWKSCFQSPAKRRSWLPGRNYSGWGHSILNGKCQWGRPKEFGCPLMRGGRPYLFSVALARFSLFLAARGFTIWIECWHIMTTRSADVAEFSFCRMAKFCYRALRYFNARNSEPPSRTKNLISNRSVKSLITVWKDNLSEYIYFFAREKGTWMGRTFFSVPSLSSWIENKTDKKSRTLSFFSNNKVE